MSWLIKQFLKRGVGSPGSIGKVVAKKFVMLLKTYNLSAHTACERIVRDYFDTYRKMGQPLSLEFENKTVELVGNNPVLVSFAISIVAQRGDSGKNKIIREKLEMIFEILNERFQEEVGSKSPLKFDQKMEISLLNIHQKLSPSYYY